MTAVDPTTELRHRLVDQLIADGALTDQAWIAAFRCVPRHAFLSRFTAVERGHAFDMSDPAQFDEAITAAYTGDVLVTQRDAAGTATSASTEVGLMARMLELLAVRDNHNVLEIGAGTGYNAALLSQRLGSTHVTSIDIDINLVNTALAAAHATGYRPTIVAGDGAGGVPANAPYDRIIATCGVHRIPAAWVSQTAPGGLILANVGFSLIRLDVHNDGSATGRFLPGTAGFMRLRDDVNHVEPTTRDLLATTRTGGTARRTTLPPAFLDHDATWLLELGVPGVRRIIVHLDGGDQHIYVDHTSGSWVRVTPTSTTTAEPSEYRERGPRALLAEVAELLTSWDQHGRPRPDRHGLTIRADGTNLLWLDDPDTVVTVLR